MEILDSWMLVPAVPLCQAIGETRFVCWRRRWVPSFGRAHRWGIPYSTCRAQTHRCNMLWHAVNGWSWWKHWSEKCLYIGCNMICNVWDTHFLISHVHRRKARAIAGKLPSMQCRRGCRCLSENTGWSDVISPLNLESRWVTLSHIESHWGLRTENSWDWVGLGWIIGSCEQMSERSSGAEQRSLLGE